MHTKMIFQEKMKSNNSKEQGNVFISKKIYEQECYLDVFCYKAIVYCLQVRMRKTKKKYM